MGLVLREEEGSVVVDEEAGGLGAIQVGWSVFWMEG